MCYQRGTVETEQEKLNILLDVSLIKFVLQICFENLFEKKKVWKKSVKLLAKKTRQKDFSL